VSAVGKAPTVGLLDTSVFIAAESDRQVSGHPPDRVMVSIVTIAELRAGVLAASDVGVRSRRMGTLQQAQTLTPLLIDDRVATAWAELRVRLRDAGRRMPVNDSWIAATALAMGVPVVTQDADYDDVPGLAVIRV
jgi:predicted nucleic acid-binding protein